MSKYFILLNLNFKNNRKQRNATDYWCKVLNKLSHGKATILYHCADTSADAFIRDHAEKLLSFTTYILLTVHLIKFDEKALKKAINDELDGKCIKNVVIRTDMYEVITSEIT
jgi:hypothetical protein